MAHAIISLRGTTLESVSSAADGTVRVRFGPAIVVKSQGIAGVDPSTRWSQAGEIQVREAETLGELPGLPAAVTGGSIECGGFKYVDMIPLPLDLPGFVELRLGLGETEVVVRGEGPTVRMEGQPKYLEHIRETQPAG